MVEITAAEQKIGEKMEAKIEKMQEVFTKDLQELKNKQR